MYNLIEYSNNYSKTSGSLWQYYGDEPAFTNAGAIANFHAAYSSTSLNPLKVVSATFLLVCLLNLTESICHTRKNVFYFTSKALFVLEKIKF